MNEHPNEYIQAAYDTLRSTAKAAKWVFGGIAVGITSMWFMYHIDNVREAWGLKNLPDTVWNIESNRFFVNGTCKNLTEKFSLDSIGDIDDNGLDDVRLKRFNPIDPRDGILLNQGDFYLGMKVQRQKGNLSQRQLQSIEKYLDR